MSTMQITDLRRCATCGQDKPLDAFTVAVRRHRRDGTLSEYLRGVCKACWAAKAQQRYQGSPEVRQAQKDSNRRYHARRAAWPPVSSARRPRRRH